MNINHQSSSPSLRRSMNNPFSSSRKRVGSTGGEREGSGYSPPLSAAASSPQLRGAGGRGAGPGAQGAGASIYAASISTSVSEASSLTSADSRRGHAETHSRPAIVPPLRLKDPPLLSLADLLRPGSGNTQDSLAPRCVAEAGRGHELELPVSGEAVSQLLARHRSLGVAYEGEDGAEPLYVCTVHLTGSYTSAISSSVKYADPSTSSKISAFPEERDVFMPAGGAAEGGGAKGDVAPAAETPRSPVKSPVKT
jgi:hypothetical protein